MTTTLTAPRPFSAALADILALLLGSAKGGALQLDARTEAGVGHEQLNLAYVEPGWLPVALLQLLEDGNWFVQFKPAIATTEGDAHPLRVEVAFARFPLPLHLKRGMQSADADTRRAILQRLDGFAARPTVIIDAVDEIAALWKLAPPLEFRSARAKIYLLQEDLAAALGATTEVHEQRTRHAATMETGHRPDQVAAHSPLAWLPLCGRHRFAGCVGARPRLRVLDLDPSRVYTLDALHAAIAAAPPVPQLTGRKK